MRTQKLASNSSSQQANPQRRSFLKRSLAGGLGLALIHGARTASAASAEDICTAKPAASDALHHFSSLMLEIHSNVSFEIQSEYRTVTRGCNELFDQLRNLVGQLEKEITRTRMKAQVRQMRELTEVGRAHANLISTSVSSADIKALVTGWALVGAQVSRTAQELLPAGDNALSAEASRVLNEIVRLVQESIPEQQARITETQKRTGALVEALRDKIGKVEKYLHEASEAAVSADNRLLKPAEAAQARAKAYDLTGRALDNLRELRTVVAENCVGKCSEALDSIDDLDLLLAGTQQWIKEPDKVLAFNAYRGDSDVARQAVARRAETWHAHPVLVERLDNVLARHCPPGSSLQTAICTTVVLLPVKGWAWWRHPSRPELINAVERGLKRASGSLACGEQRPLAEDIVGSGLV